ncbi:MAG: PQQ-binding-like beta-propeller repeat protein, partial [Gemmataceae bacterium]
LEVATQKLLWNVAVPLPAWGGVLVQPTTVTVSVGNGRLTISDPREPAGGLVQLDRTTGKQLWFHRTSEAIGHAPVLWQNHLVAADRGGTLHILRRDGQLVQQVRLPSGVIAAPHATASSLIFGTLRGDIVQLQRAADGTFLTRVLGLVAPGHSATIYAPLMGDDTELLVAAALGPEDISAVCLVSFELDRPE